MITLQQGKELVKLARQTIENFFDKDEFEFRRCDDKVLNEKRGVFVTLETHPDKKLRGCIGYPQDILSLCEACQRAAISAAFEDSRFSPLQKKELDKIVIEVSVLTKPILIETKDPKDYPKKIKIGKDGLIVQCGSFSGLLLPQVAVDYDWSAEEFLDNLAYKAGITPDYIYTKNSKLWKFQVQLFIEKSPNGEIIEREFKSD